jgi:hypothetical protein
VQRDITGKASMDGRRKAVLESPRICCVQRVRMKSSGGVKSSPSFNAAQIVDKSRIRQR